MEFLIQEIERLIAQARAFGAQANDPTFPLFQRQDAMRQAHLCVTFAELYGTFLEALLQEKGV